jgi:hypothetical protein
MGFGCRVCHHFTHDVKYDPAHGGQERRGGQDRVRSTENNGAPLSVNQTCVSVQKLWVNPQDPESLG